MMERSAEKDHENLAARLYLADRERPQDGLPFIAQTPVVQERYRVMATVAEDEFRRRQRRADRTTPPEATCGHMDPDGCGCDR